MKPINLIFPWPPSVNSLFFQGKSHGQKFLSKKGKEYKQKLHYFYADDDREPMKGMKSVQLIMIQPDKRDRDIDNFTKAVLDGLTDLKFIEDDSQIFELHTYKLPKMENYNQGLVMVTISDFVPSVFISDFHEDDPIKQFMKDNNFSAEDKLIFHKPVKKYIKKKDRIKLEQGE